MSNKRGLGRGLGALIPETSGLSHDEGDQILTLSIEMITPNPDQPRREFAPDELDALADSIQERGLLQPILVRRVGPDSYQLIAGERRWRAATRAGYERIPAIVRETADEDMLSLALIENLVRADLNPIEEALAYQDLSERAGWTQDEVAQQVSKGRVHVANTIRLLNLPVTLQREVAEGNLSRGHARALLACRDEKEMLSLYEQILTGNLTVRETEQLASQTPAYESKKPRKASKTTVRSVSAETREVEERLQRVYGTPVQIHDRGGRGRVQLEFYSYEDLDRLLELLARADQPG
jgi:ParB family chromosome partitioning protein